MKNIINRALAAEKKLFTLLLAVAASVGTMFAAPVRIGDLYYNLDATNQTAEVVRQNASGEIIIPSSVTYNSVSYSVTSIGEKAFFNCTGLTSVTIGNSVTSIGDVAFDYCTGLTSLTIGNSVISIGEGAFAYCTGLTSVTIPNSVTSIGGSAFYWCNGLTSVTIGNSVTSIGEGAFSYCSGLTSIEIPNSVTYIESGAFAVCFSLTSIDVASDNSNYCSVDGVLFNKDKTILIQYPGGKQGSYTIPNSVTSIVEWAFAGSRVLTSIDVASDNSNYCSVDGVLFNKDKTTLIQYPGGKQGSYTIPNSVTSIGNQAFYWCTGLTSVTIPNSVTSIGNNAFYICISLTSIEIPNSVTSIGNEAFAWCSGLTSVTNFANTPQEIDSYVFDNVDKSTCVLYVPAGSISDYQSADGWKDFTKILPISQQGLEDVQGNNLQCIKVVHNGQLFILREGRIFNANGIQVR